MGSDVRFQRNDYLFYSLSMYEYYRVKSNININLYLSKTCEYLNLNLNLQIRCHGPPHYFTTFSCNDLHWKDMIEAMLIADRVKDGDPKTVSTFEAQTLVEKHPVVVSRYFMIRVNTLLSLIKSDENVFVGKTVDYWWRIEFQHPIYTFFFFLS